MHKNEKSIFSITQKYCKSVVFTLHISFGANLTKIGAFIIPTL